MGNDPVNNIGPSGGLVGIPCPGSPQLGLFFARVGEFAGGAANIASRLSPWISSASGIGRIGVDVFNAGVQHQIITNQLLGNLTIQVGAKGQGNGGWQEVSILLAESKGRAGSGDDWVKNPNPQGIKIDDLSKESDNELLNDLRSTIHVYTRGVLTGVGDRIVDHFAENTGEDFSDPVLDNHINASSQFQEKLSGALKLVRAEIEKANGDFSKYEARDFRPPSFPKWDPGNPLSPNSLYTLIGGTQYGSITLIKYKYNAGTKSFTGIINVTIMDDFGVSASDVKKASNIPFSKGIRALWYLQHIRGYKPYRVVFSRQFQISF